MANVDDLRRDAERLYAKAASRWRGPRRRAELMKRAQSLERQAKLQERREKERTAALAVEVA